MFLVNHFFVVEYYEITATDDDQHRASIHLEWACNYALVL